MRTNHNNERATQIRIVRQIFFSPKSLPDWCLARNVLAVAKEHGYTAPKGSAPPPKSKLKKIKLSPMWTTIQTVEELADLLMSDGLYKNPEAYAALCSGFESGIMRRMSPLDPQPLEETLTCANEAHFRMELWYALQSPSYHHGLSAEWHKERKDNWKAAMARVHKDRTDNAAAAWERRSEDLNAIDDSDNDGGGNESGGGPGDSQCNAPESEEDDPDPKFWN